MAKKKTMPKSVSTSAYEQILQGTDTPGTLPDAGLPGQTRMRFGGAADMNPYTGTVQPALQPGKDNVFGYERKIATSPGAFAEYRQDGSLGRYSYEAPELIPSQRDEDADPKGNRNPYAQVQRDRALGRSPQGEALFGALSGLAGSRKGAASMRDPDPSMGRGGPFEPGNIAPQRRMTLLDRIRAMFGR